MTRASAATHGGDDEHVVGRSGLELPVWVEAHGRQYRPRPCFETLLVDRADGIVTITLNRPEKKNAINGAMWDELLDDVPRDRRQRDDRVVVHHRCRRRVLLRRRPSPALGGARRRTSSASMRHVGDVALALHRLPQPTIAKVRGVAAGAGHEHGARLRPRSSPATTARFSEIFARRGLTIDFGGSWLLPRLVGMHRAKELALLADIIDAAEADAHRARQPGRARRRARQVRRRLGRTPRRRPADRARPGQAAAQQRHRRSRWSRRSTTRARRRRSTSRPRTRPRPSTAFLEKRDPTFEGR